MLSSTSLSRTKQPLTKDQNSCVILVIGLCFVLGVLFLYLGSQELYKVKTLIICHCEVQSVDLKYERNSFFPRWNITIVDGNRTAKDSLIESIGTRSDRWAWIRVRKYKINETYPCYRSRNETSVIQWGWQWNKPMKLKAYVFLLIGITLNIIAMVLIIWKQRFQTKSKNIQLQQQQQQSTTLLKDEEQPTIATS